MISTEDRILELLTTPRYRYKGVPVSIFFLPVFGSYKSKTIRNKLSVLNKSEYIKKKNNVWVITKQGQKYRNHKQSSLKIFQSPFSKNANKDLLVMFDIPEAKKAERDWFRNHLRKFGYDMIQKSVWIGPSPLPKEFMAYVIQNGLKKNIKQFKLAKDINGIQ